MERTVAELFPWATATPALPITKDMPTGEPVLASIVTAAVPFGIEVLSIAELLLEILPLFKILLGDGILDVFGLSFAFTTTLSWSDRVASLLAEPTLSNYFVTERGGREVCLASINNRNSGLFSRGSSGTARAEDGEHNKEDWDEQHYILQAWIKNDMVIKLQREIINSNRKSLGCSKSGTQIEPLCQSCDVPQ